MQRTKVFASDAPLRRRVLTRSKAAGLVAAMVAAVTATVLLAGGASAATWHVYEGDVYPGHAYALEVPARAESVEFLFNGAEAGAASIAVYAPDGDKAGFYELGVDLPAASVANPDAGRYVVYVYDVVDGALSIRVNSKAEPAELELTEVSLARQDIRIGEFPNGKLDHQITSDLKQPTVFVTLLYEGSAKDLDATVASEKGTVVSIVDETATAFSPGVWTSLKGERTFDAANLDGTKYDVEIHAAQFEGRMILTTLSLDLREPVFAPVAKMPAPPSPAKAPRHAHSHEASAESAATPEFALQHSTAVAFQAPAGKLVLVDPALLERMEAEENGEEYEYGDDCQPVHGMVSIFAPDDTLVATLVLDHENPTAEVELPVAGEYVAYTHGAEREVVLAKIIGTSAAPVLRVLEIEELVQEFEVGTALFGGQDHEVDLERVPVSLDLRLSGFGALTSASLWNEDGDVAFADGTIDIAGSPMSGWSYVNYDNLAAGMHTLSVNAGAYNGNVVLTTLHYVRTSEIVVEGVAKAHAEHEHEEPEEPEEPQEPSEPFPVPMPPAPPAPVLGLLDLGW